MPATITRLYEREYISQFTAPTLGVLIHVDGVLADPDGQDVDAALYPIDPITGELGALVGSGVATREDVGDYTFTLSSADTDVPGYYVLRWEFDLSSAPQYVDSHIEVGYASPVYDALPPAMKVVVETVWTKFADGFDSPGGGPHIQTYLQTTYGRNRLAQFLISQVGKLNVLAQPHHSYTVESFPVAAWGPLLESYLTIEVIKHLRRSYVEDPDLRHVTVAYEDRRDYLTRWGQILEDEREEQKDLLDNFKIAHMGLGQPNALVAGGVYGEMRTSGAPFGLARPRYWWRFF
jgi:hypothetical protein